MRFFFVSLRGWEIDPHSQPVNWVVEHSGGSGDMGNSVVR